MMTLIEVRAPAEQSEGTRSQLQNWLKKIGDRVEENEPLIELETDKVTIEIPAPASGVLHEVLKSESEPIEPGELLGRILVAGAGEAAATDNGAAAGESESGDSVYIAARKAHADALIRENQNRISPSVKRVLAEHGVDASEVQGSGAGGRITVDDVMKYVAERDAKRGAAAAAPAIAGAQHIPHSAMRKRIAERMVESLLHTAPHVTTVFEVDFGAIMAHREAHRAEFQSKGVQLTFTAYFVAACVDAIREVPEANSRWTDDALIVPESINIGVAVALEGRGLVVPVIRDVQKLSLFEIARELGQLVERARDDKLTPADVRDGTFTISNHGVSGSLVATPIIINQPESAILGVGKLEKRAVVVTENGEDRIVIRPRSFVTLTLDHRVMDGHRANRFLQTLVSRLENWSDRDAA